MDHERQVLQASSDYVCIPSQWSDPWAWIASVLLLLGSVMVLIDSTNDLNGLWPLVPIMLSMAADNWRKVVYLGKAGAQPSQIGRQRVWAMAFLAFAIGAVVMSWGSAPWN